MVWKQDLAKLKQQFEDIGEPKPKPQAPKPMLKPEAVGTIEDEDTLFLNAMGRRQAASAPRKDKVPSPPEASPALKPPPPPAEDFQEAMGGLKGLKPLGSKMPTKVREDQPALPPVPSVESPAPVAVPEVVAPLAVPLVSVWEVPIRTGPALIHLAAGMALEVDGSLDLRGHTAADALERLRERLQDGVFLGWRTFHITLGGSEELRESLLAFLGDPEARAITRYAQAPIPMGGNQAWILYYESPTIH
jgi:hypothetical protein